MTSLARQHRSRTSLCCAAPGHRCAMAAPARPCASRHLDIPVQWPLPHVLVLRGTWTSLSNDIIAMFDFICDKKGR